MKWKRTDDPEVIASGPYFIRRGKSASGVTRYVLGVRNGSNDECLGGFAEAEQAKQEAERHDGLDRKQ